MNPRGSASHVQLCSIGAPAWWGTDQTRWGGICDFAEMVLQVTARL